MNCPECGREMLISHVEKKVEDGVEKVQKIFCCMNKNCNAKSDECRIKTKEG